ncbi:MAG TPA: DUF5691 domain-containing protein, partial [Ktedonobacteraceae bacterium]|nr:DUF5691 domain-containing protein [Ktedonobacteraceae bacterium]
MDSLVTTAIIGTGQAGNTETLTNTPVDTLAAQLDATETERRLLLTAGALAVYQQAGSIPATASAAPQPATKESLAVCSEKAAHLVQELLQGQQRELLSEALQRLKQANLRLPYALLPSALGYGTQSVEIRSALAPVLGERGHWLSQFEKKWSWLAQFLPQSAELDDAEALWQEGTSGVRRQVLQRVRASDAALGRQWLIDTWKQEKAETRALLLEALKVGLSSDDEPFLEQALDDRSESVRGIGALLLTSLPTSAFMQRILSRADAILTYNDGKFSIVLPLQYDESWQRDGIKAQTQQEYREEQLATQVLTRVPPAHWEERFAATPSELIEATTRTQDLEVDLIAVWSHATMLFGGPHWYEPLWAWLCRHSDTSTLHYEQLTAIYKALAAQLPQRVAEEYVQQQFAEGEHWHAALVTLSRPWSATFADACLEKLKAHCLALDDHTTPSSQWQATLRETP